MLADKQRRDAWKPIRWKKGNWLLQMASHYRITHIQQALMLMKNGRRAGFITILSMKTGSRWTMPKVPRMNRGVIDKPQPLAGRVGGARKAIVRWKSVAGVGDRLHDPI
jgi:hypothetical protein